MADRCGVPTIVPAVRSMWNADFSQVCHSFTLKRINELELALLDVLKVRPPPMPYAGYWRTFGPVIQ